MGQKNCIYGICNKDGRAILYNEETNQFITSTNDKRFTSLNFNIKDIRQGW